MVFLTIQSLTDAVNRIRNNGDVLYFDEMRTASRTFPEDLTECKKMQGRFPKIRTDLEKAEIIGMARSNEAPDAWIWVGAEYKGDGEYRWTDDDSLVNFSLLPFKQNFCLSTNCCRLAFSIGDGQLASYNCDSNFLVRDLMCVIPIEEKREERIRKLESAKKSLVTALSVTFALVVIMLVAVVFLFMKIKKIGQDDREKQRLISGRSGQASGHASPQRHASE